MITSRKNMMSLLRHRPFEYFIDALLRKAENTWTWHDGKRVRKFFVSFFENVYKIFSVLTITLVDMLLEVSSSCESIFIIAQHHHI